MRLEFLGLRLVLGNSLIESCVVKGDTLLDGSHSGFEVTFCHLYHVICKFWIWLYLMRDRDLCNVAEFLFS